MVSGPRCLTPTRWKGPEVTQHAELDALATLLGKAGAAGVEPQARLISDLPEDAIGFILGTVQTAILPRRLGFTVGGAPCLTVLASGGSVLRVTEVEGQQSDLLGRDLTGADVDALRDLLYRVVDGHDSFAVTTAPSTAAADLSIGGITAKHLYEACHLAQVHLSPAEVVSTFLAGVQDVLVGHQFVEEDLTLMRQDVAVPEGISTWIDTKLAVLSAYRDCFDAMSVVFFVVPETDLPLCIPVTAAPQQAFVLMPGMVVPVAEFWSRLIGSATLVE